MKRNIHLRRLGNVLVVVAVSLTVLLGFVAVALEGGLLFDGNQRAQAAADAAAIAAAQDLYAKYRTDKGKDSPSSARKAAKDNAEANGFTDVEVYIPPISGLFKDKNGYVEVIITYHQDRYFSRLWGNEEITLKARAVAEGSWAPFNMGILVLDPHEPSAMVINGGGTMTIDGVSTIVNSDAPDGANAVGGGTVNSEVYITGEPGISGSGTWNGDIHSSQPPTPDPLAYLPEPDPSTMTLQSNNPTHISQGTENLLPGIYRGGITVTGQGTLNMAPGIYYMDGGGFSFTGGGNLNAQGVMIVNAPRSNSHVINISGNGQINLTPITEGIYKGISLWQERDSTNEVAISGNGTSQITGTFYVAGGTLSVTGNGGQDVLGSQYISNLLKIGGNGSFYVDWDVDTTARSRIIRLVE